MPEEGTINLKKKVSMEKSLTRDLPLLDGLLTWATIETFFCL